MTADEVLATVDRSDPDGCWVSSAGSGPYGNVTVGDLRTTAMRHMWLIEGGAPEGPAVASLRGVSHLGFSDDDFTTKTPPPGG